MAWILKNLKSWAEDLGSNFTNITRPGRPVLIIIFSNYSLQRYPKHGTNWIGNLFICEVLSRCASYGQICWRFSLSWPWLFFSLKGGVDDCWCFKLSAHSIWSFGSRKAQVVYLKVQNYGSVFNLFKLPFDSDINFNLQRKT